MRTLVFPLLLALAACGNLPAPTTRAATFGTAETYTVGETRTYDDGLAVTLDRIDDSRCKPDVQCVWAGELAPVLTLRGGGLDTTRTVSLGTSRTARAQIDAYAVTLDSATEATATITVVRIGPAPGSGVRGIATVGPTCPVETSPPDPACADRPYVGSFAVESVGGARIAEFTSGIDGRYSIALPAGSYVVRLRDMNAMPSMAAQAVTVRSGAWTTLDLSLDSGIR